MKSDEFKSLIKSIAKCNCCLDLKDKSLINFYDSDMPFCIPSIWTDWLNHLDSEIMIIGQDWGPYQDIKKLYDAYKSGKNWNTLMDFEKSLTKKNLIKFLSLTNKNFSFDNIYVTNAIMCARMGNNYRGNNIDLKYSTKCCKKYLSEQIRIVKPKVIVTLGYYPLLACSEIFDFKIEKNLTKTIEKSSIITLGDCVLIPAYHPTAQIKLERQLEQYKKIWENL